MEKIYNKIRELISLQEERELMLLNYFRKDPIQFFDKKEFFGTIVNEYNNTSSSIKILESLISDEKYEVIEKSEPIPICKDFKVEENKKESKEKWKNIKDYHKEKTEKVKDVDFNKDVDLIFNKLLGDKYSLLIKVINELKKTSAVEINTEKKDIEEEKRYLLNKYKNISNKLSNSQIELLLECMNKF